MFGVCYNSGLSVSGIEKIIAMLHVTTLFLMSRLESFLGSKMPQKVIPEIVCDRFAGMAVS